MGAIVSPGACQSRNICLRGSSTCIGPQIEDILGIDIVGADGQRIYPMAEAMAHLDQHSLDRHRQVQRGRTNRIEPSAFCCSTIA